MRLSAYVLCRISARCTFDRDNSARKRASSRSPQPSLRPTGIAGWRVSKTGVYPVSSGGDTAVRYTTFGSRGLRQMCVVECGPDASRTDPHRLPMPPLGLWAVHFSKRKNVLRRRRRGDHLLSSRTRMCWIPGFRVGSGRSAPSDGRNRSVAGASWRSHNPLIPSLVDV